MSQPLAERYRIEPLNRHHDRVTFESGVAGLDRYLRTQAGQDERRRVASPYLAVHIATNAVAGYFTLSNSGAAASQLPPDIVRSLPKYPTIPVTLLGRLAVDARHRGIGLGEHLLLDALSRCLQSSRNIASFAVVVDAKNASAVAFYKKYGFIELPDTPFCLLLPMQAIAAIFPDT